MPYPYVYPYENSHDYFLHLARIQMSKKTYYNNEWEDPKIHPELAHFCSKVGTVSSKKLGTMGVALSHMKPNKDSSEKTKHERNLCVFQASRSITSSLPSIIVNRQADKAIDKDGGNAQQPRSTPQYFTSEVGRRTEILLAMKSVTSHISARSMVEFPELMKIMFPDSQIATQVHLHCTKLGYMMNHGLGPYYKEKVMSSLKEADRFVTCFDESFNAISNEQQLDVHIISFDETTKRVRRDYIWSAFFGHGDTDSCLTNLLEVHHGLDYVNKLIQVGMDGSM